MQFSFSTLSVVPAPFDARAFMREMRSFHVTNDGRLLFFASMDTSAQPRELSTALWISSDAEQADLLLHSGDEVPLVSGGTHTFVSELFSDITTMDDGSILIGPKGVGVIYRLFFE